MWALQVCGMPQCVVPTAGHAHGKAAQWVRVWLATPAECSGGAAMQFPDVCFGGAPGLEAAEQLGHFFPTMDLHFAGGVTLRAGPLNYLFVHAAQVR